MKRAQCILATILVLILALPGLGFAEAIVYLDNDEMLPELGREDLLEVHLINVASADCILLRMGDQTMLVDGGRYRHYERVTEYLQNLGIEKLDYVFATHPHDDHIGGLVGILQEVPVDTFMEPYLYDQFRSDLKTKLEGILKDKDIPVKKVENNTVMQLGGATLTFMQWQKADSAQNNRSMIVKVEYGNRAILLTADIESHGQRALAEEYGTALFADIMKMPHHGLTTYTKELHDAVQPSLGTVSNIKDKIYTFLRSCEKRDVKWMLTTKGTIVAVTDGETWHVLQK